MPDEALPKGTPPIPAVPASRALVAINTVSTPAVPRSFSESPAPFFKSMVTPGAVAVPNAKEAASQPVPELFELGDVPNHDGCHARNHDPLALRTRPHRHFRLRQASHLRPFGQRIVLRGSREGRRSHR